MQPTHIVDCLHYLSPPWSATSKAVPLLETDLPDGGLMLRIDETVVYVCRKTPASACGSRCFAASWAAEKSPSAPTAAHLACPVQQGYRFSHSSPSFMTAMTRMTVGTRMCYCGTACYIPKGLVRASMHRMHYCCVAADYCTEAQQDLPRVQRAGGYHVLETSCV